MIHKALKASRFMISAAVVFGADLLTFAALYQLIGIPAGAFISRAVGGIVGFLLHKRFSFGNDEPIAASEVMKFALLWLVNYVLSVAGISAGVAAFAADPSIAKGVADVIIFAANYFIMSRIFKV